MTDRQDDRDDDDLDEVEATEALPPPPEPRPEPIGLVEMADCCMVEAIRISSTQEALITAGYRVEPDEKQMRRAQVFEATARFLDAIKPHLPAVRQILKRPVGRA